MEVVFLVGRLIVGVYWLFNALNHFTGTKMMVPYAKSKGVPAAEFFVPAAGLLLLAGGVSIITGLYPLYGAIALVLFLIPVSFTMHNFWAVSDPQMKSMEMVNFTKNMALLGFTLMTLAISQPWPLSL